MANDSRSNLLRFGLGAVGHNVTEMVGSKIDIECSTLSFSLLHMQQQRSLIPSTKILSQ